MSMIVRKTLDRNVRGSIDLELRVILKTVAEA